MLFLSFYFTKDYQLTFSDADVPTHYSFKVDYAVDEPWLTSLDSLSEAERQCHWGHLLNGAYCGELFRSSADAAERALKALDERGRWITEEKLKSAKGERVRAASCEVFVKNLSALCAFLCLASRAERAACELVHLLSREASAFQDHRCHGSCRTAASS